MLAITYYCIGYLMGNEIFRFWPNFGLEPGLDNSNKLRFDMTVFLAIQLFYFESICICSPSVSFNLSHYTRCIRMRLAYLN